jgi:hypothetical protein
MSFILLPKIKDGTKKQDYTGGIPKNIIGFCGMA